jgi:hypothetical protein
MISNFKIEVTSASHHYFRKESIVWRSFDARMLAFSNEWCNKESGSRCDKEPSTTQERKGS